MAAPQEGYGGQDYPAEYAQQAGFGAPATSSPPPAEAEHHDGAGKKKKRGYAAGAFDFGAGGNAGLGGQTQGGGQFPPAQAPAYGGYPAQAEPQAAYGAPQYGAPVGAPAPGIPSPAYGAQAPYGGGVGYQAPDARYPGPGAPAPGVAGITGQMGQMGLGGAQQMPPPQPGQPQAPGAGRPAVLNQLYPTDLLNQPFNVAELELPPPPIILPPNVCFLYRFGISIANKHSSLVLPLPQMRIALQNMSDQHSTRFQQHTLCSRNRSCLLL